MRPLKNDRDVAGAWDDFETGLYPGGFRVFTDYVRNHHSSFIRRKIISLSATNGYSKYSDFFIGIYHTKSILRKIIAIFELAHPDLSIDFEIDESHLDGIVRIDRAWVVPRNKKTGRLDTKGRKEIPIGRWLPISFLCCGELPPRRLPLNPVHSKPLPIP